MFFKICSLIIVISIVLNFFYFVYSKSTYKIYKFFKIGGIGNIIFFSISTIIPNLIKYKSIERPNFHNISTIEDLIGKLVFFFICISFIIIGFLLQIIEGQKNEN